MCCWIKLSQSSEGIGWGWFATSIIAVSCKEVQCVSLKNLSRVGGRCTGGRKWSVPCRRCTQKEVVRSLLWIHIVVHCIKYKSLKALKTKQKKSLSSSQLQFSECEQRHPTSWRFWTGPRLKTSRRRRRFRTSGATSPRTPNFCQIIETPWFFTDNAVLTLW